MSHDLSVAGIGISNLARDSNRTMGIIPAQTQLSTALAINLGLDGQLVNLSSVVLYVCRSVHLYIHLSVCLMSICILSVLWSMNLSFTFIFHWPISSSDCWGFFNFFCHRSKCLMIIWTLVRTVHYFSFECLSLYRFICLQIIRVILFFEHTWIFYYRTSKLLFAHLPIYFYNLL